VPLEVDAAPVVGERWPGGGPPVVLLHAGVCDRRSWRSTVESLVGDAHVTAYDRRGFGDTPPSQDPFRHVDDLFAVLEQVSPHEPAWLVGSSMGGQVALDAALLRPDRVRGLVLMAPAVSGAPEPEREDLDPHTTRLSALLEAAWAAKDTQEVNRLETWLWLDGPAGPEGRVQGSARELALDMNAVVLAHDLPEKAGAADLSAWEHLHQVEVPVTVAWGALDVPFLIRQSQHVASRLPRATTRILPASAHLPYLEDPASVADLVRVALTNA
jgi:pimeloyl-ACP methyl ester carboxylesterase